MENVTCRPSISPPSIVPPSASTGCSTVSTASSVRRPRPTRPTTSRRSSENAYRISIAVAGFASDDIAIESKENSLTVKGAKAPETEDKAREFLHRGIAERAFELRFQLAEHVEVVGASLENGLLHIELKREVPESKKARQIAIRRHQQGPRGKDRQLILPSGHDSLPRRPAASAGERKRRRESEGSRLFCSRDLQQSFAN